MSASSDPLSHHSRNAGPLPQGAYRVVELAERGVRTKDFESVEEALAYADDVASEGDAPPVAVFDAEHRRVREGRHYGASGSAREPEA